MTVAKRAEQLIALMEKKNSTFAINEKSKIIRPETSIAQSSLFTVAVSESEKFFNYMTDYFDSIVIWDNGEYILELLGNFHKEEAIKLAESAKICEN